MEGGTTFHFLDAAPADALEVALDAAAGQDVRQQRRLELRLPGGGGGQGRWNLSVYSDLDAPALRSKSFLVEDFLPERMDVTLGLDDAPLSLGDVPQVSVDAAFLFGAPAADLAVEGEVILRAAEGLQAWSGYSFGKFDAAFDAQVNAFGGARTDALGHAVINAALPDLTAR